MMRQSCKKPSWLSENETFNQFSCSAEHLRVSQHSIIAFLDNFIIIRLCSQSHHCPTVQSSVNLADHSRAICKMWKWDFSAPQQPELMPYSTLCSVTGTSDTLRWDNHISPTSLCVLPLCHQTFPLHPALQQSFKLQLNGTKALVFSKYLRAESSRQAAGSLPFRALCTDQQEQGRMPWASKQLHPT